MKILAFVTPPSIYHKGYGILGRGKLREPWWRHAAAEQHLEATLKNISEAAGEQRRRESNRCGRGKGGGRSRYMALVGEIKEGDGFLL